MAARGSFYGLRKNDLDELMALPEEERPFFLCDTIYGRREFDVEANSQDVDKAWDALHRCLGEFPPDTPYFYDDNWSDGGAWALPENYGRYPLKLAVLGGTRLYKKDNNWLVHLVEPAAVKDIAKALQQIDREELARRYWLHCRGAWPEYGEEDLEYTWDYFQLMRDFYYAMAEDDRWVVFVADQ